MGFLNLHEFQYKLSQILQRTILPNAIMPMSFVQLGLDLPLQVDHHVHLILPLLKPEVCDVEHD